MKTEPRAPSARCCARWPGAGRARADLADASGRALPAGVPRAAGARRQLSRALLHARARAGDHAPAGPPFWHGCRDPVLRHPGRRRCSGLPVAFVEGADHGSSRFAALPRRPPALQGSCARLAPVYETVRRVRQDLPAATALIGFAGAPWTVAAYMVEGEGSKEFYAARAFARRDRAIFAQLIELLTEATIEPSARPGRGRRRRPPAVRQLGRRPARARVPALVPGADGADRGGLKAAFPAVPIIAFPRGAGLHYRSLVDAVAARRA